MSSKNKKIVLLCFLISSGRFSSVKAGLTINYSMNINGDKTIESAQVKGSVNIGQEQNADVTFTGESNIQDYFSIATCHGQSSKCPKKDMEATANIKDGAKVGASVTIIGDAAKGILNIDGKGELYTQLLWVSGNDNDKSDKINDDSNGELNVTNNSKVYIVQSKNETPFKDDNIYWNQSIISTGNNIADSDSKVKSGDLVLGKTGNGIIKVQDSSELNVSHNLIVSTGVDGAPNTKASTIDIDSK